MCGICGIVATAHPEEMETWVRAMSDSIALRGPDDSGHFIAPGVALGTRRLAILDLSPRGHMPMQTADGRYWMTYNGEVYNFRELRAGLETRGHRFTSGTDTEVILRLYAEKGPAMLPELNGMFALGIWDTREKSLFLTRDRLGVKPLFYARDGARFLFASEEKALFAAGVTPRMDSGTWEELLCFRYVAGGRTPFSGIERLLPGHHLTWKDGAIRIERWWNLSERAREVPKEVLRDPVSWYRGTFDDSVRLRRISDVPVGVLLSGGLDSSSVAASVGSQSSDPCATFTVRFAEPEYDEGPLAREVAERWKLDYNELTLSPEEVLSQLREACRVNDEPLAHGADLHLRAISRYAKSRVTVLLSGEGADETLGGYVRYRPLRHSGALRAAGTVLSWLGRSAAKGRLRKLARLSALSPVEKWALFNSSELLPEDLGTLGLDPAAAFPFREAVLREASELYPGDLWRRGLYLDQHTFLCSILDRNDRMTMGASIECRVPFLDFRLVEGLAGMPSGLLRKGPGSKGLLRRALGDRLPESVLRHRKWGFAVPWASYIRRVPELRRIVEKLSSREPIAGGPLRPEAVDEASRAFVAGDPRPEALILQLLMIVLWHETVIARRPSAPAVARSERVSLGSTATGL